GPPRRNGSTVQGDWNPHDGRRRRPSARALSDQQHLSDEVALDEDRVLGSFDASQRMFERDQRWMDPRFDATGMALGVSDQLDGIAELAGVPKIDRFDACDAF